MGYTAAMRAMVLAAAALSALAAPASAETVDEDLVPGGKVLSTLFPAGEVETYRVAAPAGSVLSVDLRPLRRGAFVPALAATLSDGAGAVLPAPDRKGRTRGRIPFPVDGTLEILVLAARGGAGDYQLRTRLAVPAGVDVAGTIEGPGGIAFEYVAPAGAFATVTVKSAAGSEVIPTIESLEGPGGPVEPGLRRANPRMDQWRKVPQPAHGPWTLTVVGNVLTTGPFTGTIRWKAPRGPDEDHRGPSDPASLEGSYAALLTVADAASASLPSVLTGRVDFDGRGLARTALALRGLSEDASSPFGIGLSTVPVGSTTGSYFTDGTTAAVSLDLGASLSVSTNFTVAAGGTVLHAGVGSGSPFGQGLLIARTPVPAPADLAGTWLYVDADGGASPSVEIGSLSIASGGTLTGIGVRTSLSLVGGVPTPGAQTPVFRTGSLSVGEDGTVTIVTVPNLFGAPESWTASTVLGSDILAGLDDAGGGGRLFVRQGTGLAADDVSGDYLHFGIEFGGSLRLRSGILGFDGAGGWTGQETVIDLGSGVPPATTPATGTYSVDAQGIANFGLDGGFQGTGVAGPGARYLFTASLGGAGFGIDLLLDLE